MKAAAIDRFGPPSVIRTRTVPVPEPGPNQLLIEVHAAGLGIWDAMIRQGVWADEDTEMPMVPGTDGAGIVAAKGSRVRRFEVGDRVYGYEFMSGRSGFCAEYVVVDATHAATLPRRLDFLHGGALPVTGLTALQGIDNFLDLRKGDTVLIVGASGAVGTLAVQLARRRGARVIATASGRDAMALVEHLGAEVVIDERKKDALNRLQEAAPDGIDAALVLAGAKTLEAMLDEVRSGGRIAYPRGVEPEPKRRKKVRVERYDAVGNPREYEKLERAINEARLQVPIAATYPLAQAARAHARIEKGHVLGRIAIQVRRGR
jgi:NADPH:quinone reductase-like Zn-dependent oxidoreductase